MSGTTNPYGTLGVATVKLRSAWDEGRVVGDAEGYARGLSDAAARARTLADEHFRHFGPRAAYWYDVGTELTDLADDLDALRANGGEPCDCHGNDLGTLTYTEGDDYIDTVTVCAYCRQPVRANAHPDPEATKP